MSCLLGIVLLFLVLCEFLVLTHLLPLPPGFFLSLKLMSLIKIRANLGTQRNPACVALFLLTEFSVRSLEYHWAVFSSPLPLLLPAPQLGLDSYRVHLLLPLLQLHCSELPLFSTWKLVLYICPVFLFELFKVDHFVPYQPIMVKAVAYLESHWYSEVVLIILCA